MAMTKKELLDFYTKLIRETASGTQKVVCEKNGIALDIKSAAELCPIPVYESNAAYSLLTSANLRTPTEILWATNHNYTYLPAYFKKIRRDGRLRNEIVITTDNYCEARFFAAKELMHCFMDDDGHQATNSIPLVKELMESLAVGLSSINEPIGQTIVDEVAWLGASEYLVPSSWVPLLVKVHEQISAREPASNAYLHIAQLIRVPEMVLRVRLRNAMPFTMPR